MHVYYVHVYVHDYTYTYVHAVKFLWLVNNHSCLVKPLTVRVHWSSSFITCLQNSVALCIVCIIYSLRVNRGYVHVYCVHNHEPTTSIGTSVYN